MTTKKREGWIDVCRGIGILIVMLGHSGPPPLLNKIICSFHMPLFFIISGYLFDPHENLNTKDYINRNIKRYITPYFIYAAINLAIEMTRLKIHGEINLISRLIRYIGGILYSRGSGEWMPNCSPLWYLTCIFCAVLLMRFIILNVKRYRIAVVAFLSLFTAVLSYFSVPKLFWNIDTAMAGVAFIYLGYMMRKFDILQKMEGLSPVVKVCITVFCLAVWGGAVYANPVDSVSFDNNSYGNYILMIIAANAMCICIIACCKSIVEKHISNKIFATLVKPLQIFGRNTIFVMAFDYVSGVIGFHIFRNHNSYKLLAQKVVIMFAVLLIVTYVKTKKAKSASQCIS